MSAEEWSQHDFPSEWSQTFGDHMWQTRLTPGGRSLVMWALASC
jgi:hypothetical protein